MRLRNKKTGKIVELDHFSMHYNRPEEWGQQPCSTWNHSLAELNEEWEDYEPAEPLIKDEKIRKIVRALFDVWEVEDVKIDSNKYFLVTTIEAIGKGWKLEIPSININGVFKPTELCGEEEE